MKIAYFDYARDLSVRHYVENLVRELTALGVRLIPFRFGEPLPEGVDLYWDPRLTGTVLPTERFKAASKPCVITMHDGAPFTLLPWEYYPNWQIAYRSLKQAVVQRYRWRKWRGVCTAIITVSESAKLGIQRALGLRDENIVVIYHGVDHRIFRPSEDETPPCRYLLHVSQYQPVKNLARVFRAYQRIRDENTPELIVVSPRYPHHNHSLPGIRLVRESLSHADLVPLYQNACGFVFPSLHETFGMPLIEAMACGCPVITSNGTACKEVGGDAALLVNPRRVPEIAAAMQQLVANSSLRGLLRRKGIVRASAFRWEKSARQHLEVFAQAATGTNGRHV